jgi:hypothetical protein
MQGWGHDSVTADCWWAATLKAMMGQPNFFTKDVNTCLETACK